MNDNERMLNKLDELDKRLDSIALILERNTYSLEIHERRTTISEQRLGHIEKHVFVVNAMGKIALFTVGFSGFFLTILEIKKILGK